MSPGTLAGMNDGGFTLGQLWTDEELCGRIYVQATHLSAPALLGDLKEKFFEHVFSAMHKLAATRYHLDNYARVEHDHAERARKLFKKHPDRREEAFELIFELEAFLLQVKSSLDMLAKLVSVVVGEGTVHTDTYGAEGDKLVKGLEQYKKRGNANVAGADRLIALIKADKADWIAKVVSIRDDIAHYRGVRRYQFEPLRLPDGGIGVAKPRFRDLDTLQFMRLVYSNNIQFHQDFMCLALALRAPPALALGGVETASAIQQFGKYGKFVKWGWNMPQGRDRAADSERGSS